MSFWRDGLGDDGMKAPDKSCQPRPGRRLVEMRASSARPGSVLRSAEAVAGVRQLGIELWQPSGMLGP